MSCLFGRRINADKRGLETQKQIYRRGAEEAQRSAAEIYFSCDCRDTDLWVRLLDVAPDGTAYNLMSPGLDVMRASYRNGRTKRDLLTPGRIYKLRFDKLMTSNLFKQGHRIRVQVSAAFMPHMSRNLHSGELEMTSARMQKANIRIHHDRRHQSLIKLPVVTKLSFSGN